MKFVTLHSIGRASDFAVSLWALASTHYPKNHTRLLDIATTSSFALNARRAMEVLSNDKTYILRQPRWRWNPGNHGKLIGKFKEACNHIVHAQEFLVGFEDLLDEDGFIKNGTQVIPYIRAQTDYKELAFIDPFALSWAFLYEVLPDLQKAKDNYVIGNNDT